MSDLDTAEDGGLNASDMDTKPLFKPQLPVILTVGAWVFACGFLAVVVAWGIHFMPKKPAQPVVVAAPATPLPAPAATDKDAEIAQLQQQIVALRGQLQTPSQPVPGAPVYQPDSLALAQLSARMDRIEANQRALAHAVAVANAAAALQNAARGSGPFLSELAVVEPALDDPNLVTPLHAYAEHGVPSEVTLAVDFPAAAARANQAARSETGKANWLQRFLAGVISIRRTDGVDGPNLTDQDAQALLHNAEVRLNAGDLKGAMAYLNALPAPVQTAIKPWLDQARARLLVDDATQRITEVALSRLNLGGDTALAAGGAL